jgi:hypothetical protein
MKKLLWIGLLVFFFQGSYAQFSLGQLNSNYSGISGSLINPSSMINSKLSADINLFSVHGFVENNYLYFPSRQASFVKLLNGVYDYPLFPKPYGTGNRYVYSYYYDKSLKNAFVNTRIMGPSFMLTFQDHMVGLRTGARAMSSTRRLPYDMANFSYYTMDFRPQHNTYFVRDNYDMSTMAWYEVMVTYSTVFNRGKSNLWSAGISAGPLFGYSGAYVIGGDTRYIVYNSDVLNVEQLNCEFGMSLPVDYNNDEIDYLSPAIRGLGWGMDLGITWQYRDKPYQRKIPNNCYKKRFEEYEFKVGVSLIDIGYVKFTKNTERHVFENVHNNWIVVNELDYDNIKDELNDASTLFYGDSTASYRGDNMKIYLPSTLSVQFDYHVKKNWYVNSTVFIPVVYVSPMIERPSVLALTPRYESRFLEINLPLVLYDYKYPRFGLSVRIDGFTIGSDNLMCFTSSKDFTGADIYVSYRIMLRNDGKNPYTSRGACYNNWRTAINKTRRSNR